jgi:hypothetical protein
MTWIAARPLSNLRDEIVVRRSRCSERVVQNKEIAWGIEAPANFASQIAPVAGLAGGPPVIFLSRNVRKDLASQLNHVHGHGRLRHESIVDGYCVDPSVWKNCVSE